MRIEHRGVRVFVHLAHGTALPRHAVELLVARTAILLRRSHAGAEEIWLRHARGGDLAEYQRVLRCGVRFRQPSIRLALHAVDLERPLRTANPQAAAALARALGMSGRTLARRLALEQRGFSDIVDEVRRREAERLIAEPSLDIGQIAGQVGFADLAAFGKAFRRWFGVSPSAYRARRPG